MSMVTSHTDKLKKKMPEILKNLSVSMNVGDEVGKRHKMQTFHILCEMGNLSGLRQKQLF